MSTARGSLAKRWCFTINNPTEADRFWEEPDKLEMIKYIVLQTEKGEQGTPHYQGFLILKDKKRMTWLKSNFNERAHWAITRGTDKQASDYCKKDDTRVPGGYTFEHGTFGRNKDELEEQAIKELEEVKKNFKRPADIPAELLLQPNFVSAYKLLTQEALGPYRPNLKIITIVGPPATGKSYLINKLFPTAARMVMGNTGAWWLNPTSKVGVIEEFAGQIPLTRMLHLLDPYPLSLEVKGGTRPCLFELIFITSNSNPEEWYAPKNADEGIQSKKHASLLALYDRLGYHPIWHHGTLSRKCGYYLEPPQLGAQTTEWILESRRWLEQQVKTILGIHDEEQHGEAAQPAAAAAAAAAEEPPAAAEAPLVLNDDDTLTDVLGLDDDFEPAPHGHSLTRQNAMAGWDDTDLF